MTIGWCSAGAGQRAPNGARHRASRQLALATAKRRNNDKAVFDAYFFVDATTYSPAMRPARAIEELELLMAEAEHVEVVCGGEHFTSWKAKVRGLLSASLGADDHLLERFDEVRYSLSFWTDSTSDSAFQAAHERGIRDVCGIIEAAIEQLKLKTKDGDEPVDHRSYDPELWEHVKNLVSDQDWGKVASQTAIFVEDRVREWAGDPKSGKGESLVGRELMGRVFSDDSDWRVGSRAAEREAWRALATGFAGALSKSTAIASRGVTTPGDMR